MYSKYFGAVELGRELIDSWQIVRLLQGAKYSVMLRIFKLG